MSCRIPASRHQPQGLRGPSRVLDPASFDWTDAGFRPPPLEQLVSYELHVGTFTAAGHVRRARAEQLAALRELGVNAVELMPVADFPGERGWGYDGVYLSAAHRAYGGPAALRASSTPPTRAGIAVILDVVYNHVGACGCRRDGGLRPILHRPLRDVLGQGDQLRRRAVRSRARVGAPERRPAGSATFTSTACGWTPFTRSTTRAPRTSSRERATAFTRPTRARS